MNLMQKTHTSDRTDIESVGLATESEGEQNERLDSSTNFFNDSFIRCPVWGSLLQPNKGNRMNAQPEALRLADELMAGNNDADTTQLEYKAAAELRRLHEVNQELMEMLGFIIDNHAPAVADLLFGEEVIDAVRAALAKARGNT